MSKFQGLLCATIMMGEVLLLMGFVGSCENGTIGVTQLFVYSCLSLCTSYTLLHLTKYINLLAYKVVTKLEQLYKN